MADAATPTPLDATLAKAMRLVVPCATLPLLFGVIAFVGWFVCYWNYYVAAEKWFVMMAVGAVVVGCLGVLLGGTVFISQIAAARRIATDEQRRRVLMHTGFLGTLLVINFPLAFFMGVVAIGAFPSVVVHIDNQSAKTLLDVTVTDAGEHELPKAFGGRVTRVRFRPSAEFVELTGTLDGKAVTLLTDDDLSATDWGTRVWATLKRDGQLAREVRTAIPRG